MSYEFDEDDMREWSWLELVAQLDEESLKYVVEDGDDSRGLIGCEFKQRPGSYDHKSHNEKKAAGRPQKDVQLLVWDFVLMRSDGSALRLHPQWNTTKVETYAVEGHETPVQIPKRSLGGSDGPGTYRYYKELGNQKTLRFGKLCVQRVHSGGPQGDIETYSRSR